MKRTLKRLEHYTSLRHVMENHPEVFEGKSALLEAKAEFEQRLNRLSEIVAELSVLLFTIYNPKKVAERELNEAMLRMTSLGCLEAHIRKDTVMLAAMKSYKSQVRKVACSTLYYNALQTVKLLESVSSSIAGKDFHSLVLPAFSRQVKEFGRELEKEAAQLQRRKLLRNELAALIASTNLLLHEQFDNLAFIMKLKYPVYYLDWTVLRGDGSRKRRKKVYNIVSDGSIEQSTTVKAVALVSEMTAKSETIGISENSEVQTSDDLQPSGIPVYIPDLLRLTLQEFMDDPVTDQSSVSAFRLPYSEVANDNYAAIVSGNRLSLG
jgi:hypothetical protein